jgi:hypothetical protein
MEYLRRRAAIKLSDWTTRGAAPSKNGAAHDFSNSIHAVLIMPRMLLLSSCLLFSAAVVFALPQAAWAGMPSIHVSELARPRLDVISFFLVILLASSAAVWGIWNWLRSDFPRLPRLSFAKACGLVALWGLFFVVVLTMISGARELMTPGAWERVGYTHQLRSDDYLSSHDDAEMVAVGGELDREEP